MNWPSPAGGCAGSGEERDHAGFQLGRARGTHSITAQPQAPPRGSALVQGCILPAHLPAQGIPGFSKRKDRQSCAVVATPVIPGRTDMEVTLGKLRRRLGSPFQGDGGSCSALSHSPSASHSSSARSDTRHLRQRRAPALGWPGWPSVAPWKVKKNKTKQKNRQIPPSAAFLCRKKDLIGTGACAERGRGRHQLPNSQLWVQKGGARPLPVGEGHSSALRGGTRTDHSQAWSSCPQGPVGDGWQWG